MIKTITLAVILILSATVSGLLQGASFSNPLSFLIVPPPDDPEFERRIDETQIPDAEPFDQDVDVIDPTLLEPYESDGMPQWESSHVPPKLQPHEQDFLDAGALHGVDPSFLLTISMHETGNGTSKAFRQKNNAMGVCKGGGGPSWFATVRESILYQAKRLADPNGPYRNCNTLEDYGRVYCPVGASNDPRGLNKHWIPTIRAKLAAINPSSPLL